MSDQLDESTDGKDWTEQAWSEAIAALRKQLDEEKKHHENDLGHLERVNRLCREARKQRDELLAALNIQRQELHRIKGYVANRNNEAAMDVIGIALVGVDQAISRAESATAPSVRSEARIAKQRTAELESAIRELEAQIKALEARLFNEYDRGYRHGQAQADYERKGHHD